MPSKVQLTGGGFQDSEGNVLNLGYLEMELSQDGLVTGVGQVVSGITIRINLTSAGNVSTSPAQSVWGNDQLLPANSYYRVTGYTAAGQRAWGPNNQQVTGSGGTFDVGTWVPNQVISWTPPLQPLELKVNGTDNADQQVLDFVDTATVTFVDNGDGSVSATAIIPPPPDPLLIQVNSSDALDQALLNLVGLRYVSIQDFGADGVTIGDPYPTLDSDGNALTTGQVLTILDPPLIAQLAPDDTSFVANVGWTTPSSGGSILQVATLLLTASDIKTGFRIQMVAAQANKIFWPVTWYAEFIPNTTPYSGTGNFDLKTHGTIDTSWTNYGIDGAGFWNQPVKNMATVPVLQAFGNLGGSSASQTVSSLANSPLDVVMSTNPTSGDGTVVVTVIYYTLSV